MKTNFFGKYQIYSHGGKNKHKINIKEYIKQIEEMGAGELFINSIDRDGMMKGYDVDLIRMVTETVSIPVIACGGAGKLDDCAEVIKEGGASAAAAGSLFVYHGKHKAILINYPTQNEMNQILH